MATRSYTYWAVQLQKMARGLKNIPDLKIEEIASVYVAKTISYVNIMQLICAFILAYAKSRFLMTWLIYFILKIMYMYNII